MRTAPSIFAAIAVVIVIGLVGTARADGDERTGRRFYQTTNIVEFGNPSNMLGGAATMVRSPHEVSAVIATSGLDLNAAYTVWWVVFNDPRACVEGCGGDDLARPETNSSVFYATGFVTGNDGTANISFGVGAGALPNGVDVLVGRGLRAGNGLGAEIHLVVRGHGPVIPGMVAKQISTFDAECAVCADQQAAVFGPVH